MALWKKLWLLFAVIWTVVASLNVFTILAFAEGELDRGKVWLPLVMGFAVPGSVYVVLFFISRWRGWQRPER